MTFKLLALVLVTSFTNVEMTPNKGDGVNFKITTEEFKKVDSNELTPPVVEEILKQYPTSKLAAVYKNSKNQFKLIMVLQSGTRRTVYIDQYGRWFKPKKH